MKKNLQNFYNNWRKQIEELNEEAKKTDDNNLYGTWDCGEFVAREDFTACLEASDFKINKDDIDECGHIKYKIMLKLEENYEE